MKIHDYQIFGARWLASRSHAILADEMGIGKSAQSIRACELVEAEKILVVCRAVARFNWRNEFEIWSVSPRPVRIIEDTSPILGGIFEGVTICSFEGMGCVLNSLGDLDRFDVVIVDEAHFVKSTEAIRSKQVFGIHGLVRKTKKMWLLTGTPTPNGYASELWLALYTFGACKFGLADFIKFFCTSVTTGYGVKVTGTKRDSLTLDSWKRMTENFLLRRELRDTTLNLPEIIYETVTVAAGSVDIEAHEDFLRYSMTPELRQLLNDKLEAEYAILKGILDDNSMSPELLEIIKASAGSIATLRRFNGLQKVEGVIELVKGELESDPEQKIVIFAMHRSCIKRIAEGLSAFGAVTIWGGSKQKTVDRNVQKFQEIGSKTRVIVGQIIAAGTSLNLTAANEVMLVEEDYVPGNNDQAIKRVLRIGQEKMVRARFIRLDDPLERRVTELVAKKTEEIHLLYAK